MHTCAELCSVLIYVCRWFYVQLLKSVVSLNSLLEIEKICDLSACVFLKQYSNCLFWLLVLSWKLMMVLCEGRNWLQDLLGEYLGSQCVQHCNSVVLSHPRLSGWEWVLVALVKLEGRMRDLIGIDKSLNISCNLFTPHTLPSWPSFFTSLLLYLFLYHLLLLPYAGLLRCPLFSLSWLGTPDCW